MWIRFWSDERKQKPIFNIFANNFYLFIFNAKVLIEIFRFQLVSCGIFILSSLRTHTHSHSGQTDIRRNCVPPPSTATSPLPSSSTSTTWCSGGFLFFYNRYAVKILHRKKNHICALLTGKSFSTFSALLRIHLMFVWIVYVTWIFYFARHTHTHTQQE